jgi:pimeloyl-ACP methyl ester carboxylesterase
MKKLHIIYVPGIGDAVAHQGVAVRSWRWYGVTSELAAMPWGDKETWQPKFDRLLARIDAATARGQDVALVGASAGASAVINAYAARPESIIGIVCIAGKINRPQSIGERYHQAYPAFITSAYECSKALKHLSHNQRRRILSRYALLDGVVDKADSHIAGAKNRFSPTIGHFLTIGLQLVFGAPSFIYFLKQQQKRVV